MRRPYIADSALAILALLSAAAIACNRNDVRSVSGELNGMWRSNSDKRYLLVFGPASYMSVQEGVVSNGVSRCWTEGTTLFFEASDEEGNIVLDSTRYSVQGDKLTLNSTRNLLPIKDKEFTRFVPRS